MISKEQQQHNSSTTSKRDNIIPQLRLPDISAAVFYIICVNVFDRKETCPFIGEVEQVKEIDRKNAQEIIYKYILDENKNFTPEGIEFGKAIQKIFDSTQKIVINEKIAMHYEETDIVSTFVVKVRGKLRILNAAKILTFVGILDNVPLIGMQRGRKTMQTIQKNLPLEVFSMIYTDELSIDQALMKRYKNNKLIQSIILFEKENDLLVYDVLKQTVQKRTSNELVLELMKEFEVGIEYSDKYKPKTIKGGI
jgi:hypothetical protein